MWLATSTVGREILIAEPKKSMDSHAGAADSMIFAGKNKIALILDAAFRSPPKGAIAWRAQVMVKSRGFPEQQQHALVSTGVNIQKLRPKSKAETCRNKRLR
jgi:hypothetical protein